MREVLTEVLALVFAVLGMELRPAHMQACAVLLSRSARAWNGGTGSRETEDTIALAGWGLRSKCGHCWDVDGILKKQKMEEGIWKENSTSAEDRMSVKCLVELQLEMLSGYWMFEFSV